MAHAHALHDPNRVRPRKEPFQKKGSEAPEPPKAEPEAKPAKEGS